MKHLDLKRLKNLSTYQRLSIGSWKDAKDPSIYGWHDIDYSQAGEFANKVFKEQKIKLTPTYLVAQAVSLVFASHPKLNTLLRGDVLYQRERIGFSFLVALGEGLKDLDLSSCVVHDITGKDLLRLHKVLSEKIERTKQNKDEVVQTQNHLLKKIPTPLMRYFLNISSFLLYTLNLRFKGFPEDPFGSVMISNLGQIGIDNAFIPLVSYARVPVLIAIGLVKPRPVVTGKREVVARDMLRINYTIDHRYIDGKSLALMEKMLFMAFQNPERWLLPSPESIKDAFLKEFNQSGFVLVPN